jgi:hypothetical protein
MKFVALTVAWLLPAAHMLKTEGHVPVGSAADTGNAAGAAAATVPSFSYKRAPLTKKVAVVESARDEKSISEQKEKISSKSAVAIAGSAPAGSAADTGNAAGAAGVAAGAAAASANGAASPLKNKLRGFHSVDSNAAAFKGQQAAPGTAAAASPATIEANAVKSAPANQESEVVAKKDGLKERIDAIKDQKAEKEANKERKEARKVAREEHAAHKETAESH